MSTQLKNILASTLVVLAVVVGLFFLFAGHLSPTSAKAGTVTVSNLATNAPDGQYSGTQGASEADLGFFDATGAVSNILGVLGFGPTIATAWNFKGSGGNCSTVSTSTLFGVANPFGATSTATVYIDGVAASSTSVQVGTSTRTTGITQTSISHSLVNTTIATSSAFDTFSGLTFGGNGYQTAGSGTYQTIIVGTNESVVGFATSSFSTGINIGLPTCSYKILWNN